MYDLDPQYLSRPLVGPFWIPFASPSPRAAPLFMYLTRHPFLLVIVLLQAVTGAWAQTAFFDFTAETVLFPAEIEGKTYHLETKLYRPKGAARQPLVIFSHGRNGPDAPRDPRTVEAYPQLCQSLVRRGYVVAYIVRRGYGNSDGPDSELKETAVLSGLEAAKDYKAAVDYWRRKDFVLPDKIVLIGQSQGGWAVLACTNVPMPGVVGVVNISGGTNYRGINESNSVYAHWVTSSSELGRNALVPSLWIYSENDRSIPGPTARAMFAAFTASGGNASLVMLPAYGDNGHSIVDQPTLFRDELNAFLNRIGFAGETPALPAISAASGPTKAIRGRTAVFRADVEGNPTPQLRWKKDGVPLQESSHLVGVTTATLIINDVQPEDVGRYDLSATNSSGTVVSPPLQMTLIEAPPQVPVANGSTQTRIVNLSTRGIVATGENSLIAGFIVAGSAPKKLLIVASGLTLSRQFGVTGEIGRPKISLHHPANGEDVTLAENSDWQSNAAEVLQTMSALGVQPRSPSFDPAHGDAALVLMVEPGAYTAVVAPDAKSANQDGIGLIEVFDASPQSNSWLINISSRGRVESGARQMIVGVVTRGPAPSRLLIRAVGPSLRDFGVIGRVSNPSQSLHANESNSSELESNDDWWVSPQVEQLASLMPQMGLFPFAPFSTDSVLLLRLDPGGYTSVISSKDNVPGVVLTEIYDANVP